MTHLDKKVLGLFGLASLLILATSCAEDKEAISASNESLEQPNVDAMFIGDAPFIAPIPVPPLPIAPPLPLPPVPLMPPPFIPPVPGVPILTPFAPPENPPAPIPLIPGPLPFLNGARDVPPHQANLVSGKGQYPSRHGNPTFLYSFERDNDDGNHRRHHRRHRHHDHHDDN